MSGTCKSGFTLIEILVAITILVVMAAIVAPRLAPKRPKEERKAFVAQLNALTQLAWQTALTTNVLQRILFDFKKKTVSVEQSTGEKDNKGDLKFTPLQRTYLETTISWPENLQIKNFFLEGFDEMKRFSGRDTGETWFYIVPDGMTQRVTINMLDTQDMQPDGRLAKVGLVLNPFTAQFVAYDTFKQ